MQIRTWILILMLLGTVFLCYGNTINNGFVWDDNYLIKYNPLIRAPLLSPYRFTQDIANSHFTKSGYYRPLQIFSYALDYRIYKLKPVGYHFTNIFLHFAGALLVFFLTFKLCGDKYLSMIVSLLFAVFPANISAVSYVAGRSDLLYFSFGILSLFLFLLFKEKKKIFFLIYSGIALILALLSKEAAVAFPLILLFLDLLIYGKKQFKIKDHFIFLLILVLYLIGNILLRADTSILSGSRITFSGALVAFINMWVSFLKAVFLPFQASVRSVLKSLSGLEYLIGLMALILFSFMTVFSGRNKKLMIFAGSILIFSLVPFVLGMMKMEVIGYHWFYMASYGFFLFVSLAVFGFFDKMGILAKRIGIIVAIFIIGSYSLITVIKNASWGDDISLSDSIGSSTTEDGTPLRFKYAELLHRNENGKVIELAGNDIEKNPESALARTLQGVMLLETGDLIQARESFSKAISLNPSFSEAYIGLARVSISENKNIEAIDLLKEAISMNNKNQKAYILIAPLYSKQGLLQEALMSAEKAVDLNPYTYNALINLGSAYLQSGKPYEGMEQYTKAVKLYPEEPLAYYNIGSVFYYSGNKIEAEKWFKKALSVDNKYGPALNMMELIK